MTIAVYAGSFDPVTKGHLDLIYRASKKFDGLIVGVGVNAGKQPLFTPIERMLLIQSSIDETWHAMHKRWTTPEEESVDPESIRILSFDGLLVDFCKQQRATVIIRGLRAVTDFEQEMGIADANTRMVPTLDTFFLPTRPKFSFVSSSVVREIARHPSRTGWDTLPQYVPHIVVEALSKKFPARAQPKRKPRSKARRAKA